MPAIEPVFHGDGLCRELKARNRLRIDHDLASAVVEYTSIGEFCMHREMDAHGENFQLDRSQNQIKVAATKTLDYGDGTATNWGTATNRGTAMRNRHRNRNHDRRAARLAGFFLWASLVPVIIVAATVGSAAQTVKLQQVPPGKEQRLSSYLQADGPSGTARITINLNQDSDWETKTNWTIDIGGDNRMTVRSAFDSRYLARDPSGAIVLNEDSGPDAEWTLSCNRDGSFAIGAPADLRPSGLLDKALFADGFGTTSYTEPKSYGSPSVWLAWSAVPPFAAAALEEVVDTLARTGSLATLRGEDRTRILLALSALPAMSRTDGDAYLKRMAAATLFTSEDGRRTSGLAVPASVPRVTKEVLLSGDVLDAVEDSSPAAAAFKPHESQFYSTGLYAAPGETIDFIFPQALVDRNAEIRIGHMDTVICGNAAVKRYPFSLVSTTSITGTSMAVSNPFGGVIQIRGDRKGKAPFDPNGIAFTVSGAVEMAVIETGENNKAVDGKLERMKAPWAEVRGTRIAAILPAAELKAVKDHARGIGLWERVAEAQDHFTGQRRGLKGPDLIAFDAQMPPGTGAYTTGGRLVRAPLSWIADYLDPAPATAWGLAHEIGHMHQAPAWTLLAGSGEISVNFMTLEAFRTVWRLNFSEAALASGPFCDRQRFRQIADFLALDAKEKRKRWEKTMPDPPIDSFIGLTPFALIGEEFGWDAFAAALASYASDTSLAGRSTETSAQTLAIQLSKAVKHNLSAYFALWGLELSGPAKAHLESLKLPDWAPDSAHHKVLPFRHQAFVGLDPEAVKCRSWRDLGGGPVEPGLARIQAPRFERLRDRYSGNVLWTRGGREIYLNLRLDRRCGTCAKHLLYYGLRGRSSVVKLDETEAKSVEDAYAPFRDRANLRYITIQAPLRKGVYEVVAIAVPAADPQQAQLALQRLRDGRPEDVEAFALVIVDN